MDVFSSGPLAGSSSPLRDREGYVFFQEDRNYNQSLFTINRQTVIFGKVKRVLSFIGSGTNDLHSLGEILFQSGLVNTQAAQYAEAEQLTTFVFKENCEEVDFSTCPIPGNLQKIEEEIQLWERELSGLNLKMDCFQKYYKKSVRFGYSTGLIYLPRCMMAIHERLVVVHDRLNLLYQGRDELRSELNKKRCCDHCRILLAAVGIACLLAALVFLLFSLFHG